MDRSSYGQVVLMGGGETSPFGKEIFSSLLEKYAVNNIAILETPAGFELNSQKVAGNIANFIKSQVSTNIHINIVPARKRHTNFSPDDSKVVACITDADLIFMGPGSPTYAARQLKDSLAWKLILERFSLGTHLFFSSAATIAVGKYVLPIYEIYKVGEELFWAEGLDLFGTWDQQISFVPHWNNTEGGKERDTSRCYIGEKRFSILLDILPDEQTIVGIDENTALVVDVSHNICQVMGEGNINLLNNFSAQTPTNIQSSIAINSVINTGNTMELSKLFRG
jgi:cyanophycinase-like exopeptidase